MTINVANQVSEIRVLDSPPFPIEFCCVSVHVPVTDKSALQVNCAQYKDFIQEVEHLERYVADVYTSNTPPPLSKDH